MKHYHKCKNKSFIGNIKFNVEKKLYKTLSKSNSNLAFRVPKLIEIKHINKQKCLVLELLDGEDGWNLNKNLSLKKFIDSLISFNNQSEIFSDLNFIEQKYQLLRNSINLRNIRWCLKLHGSYINFFEMFNIIKLSAQLSILQRRLNKKFLVHNDLFGFKRTNNTIILNEKLYFIDLEDVSITSKWYLIDLIHVSLYNFPDVKTNLIIDYLNKSNLLSVDGFKLDLQLRMALLNGFLRVLLSSAVSYEEKNICLNKIKKILLNKDGFYDWLDREIKPYLISQT